MTSKIQKFLTDPQTEATEGPEVQSIRQLANTVTSGMLWSLLGIGISKGASFGAQLVLGWLLSTEDFALYAIAISWSTIGMALRNGGTQRLLIQKGAQYSELAAIYLKIALIFNTMSFGLLAISAPFLSALYESPLLNQMMWLLGLSIPLGSAATIFQARLSFNLEFARSARLTIWSTILRYASMVLFAWAGLGPLSFVLPLILVPLFETVISWHWVGGWPINHVLTWPTLRQVLLDTRWVMLTALASALTVNGDYIAVSLLQSKEVLGVYFFGFQLSLALVVLFTSSLDTVMMPTFSFLNTNTVRQTAMFKKGVRLLTVGSTFACFALLISAEALIHQLWAGKWDSAIPVVQLLSLSMPVRLIVPLCRAILEARGEWKVVSILFIFDGMGTILAGAIGAWSGGLITIAAVVSGYNFLFGLFYCGAAALKIRAPLKDIFRPIMSTLGIGAMATVIGLLLSILGTLDITSFWQVAIVLVIYSGAYVALIKAFLGESFSDVINLALRRIPRIPCSG
ncbi:MAG: hypothetical protein OJF51_005131 [Nitrospira sp.]|jgi:PST family polysaccharide transporter|nr:MAG: hypothetical protein OJF51_005131 [Nitrospira sp.]